MPKVFRAFAAASPASPPPTIAILQLAGHSSAPATRRANPEHDRSTIAEPSLRRHGKRRGAVLFNARVAPAGGEFYAGASTVEFDPVVNLKTAKAINLKITDAFLLRADELIG